MGGVYIVEKISTIMAYLNDLLHAKGRKAYNKLHQKDNAVICEDISWEVAANGRRTAHSYMR